MLFIMLKKMALTFETVDKIKSKVGPTNQRLQMKATRPTI